MLESSYKINHIAICLNKLYSEQVYKQLITKEKKIIMCCNQTQFFRNSCGGHCGGHCQNNCNNNHNHCNNSCGYENDYYHEVEILRSRNSMHNGSHGNHYGINSASPFVGRNVRFF